MNIQTRPSRILVLYIWPKPGIRNERTAAMPGFHNGVSDICFPLKKNLKIKLN